MLWIIIVGLICLSIYQFKKNFEVFKKYYEQKIEILRLFKEIQMLNKKITSLRNRIDYIKKNGVDYHVD